LNFAILWIFRK